MEGVRLLSMRPWFSLAVTTEGVRLLSMRPWFRLAVTTEGVRLLSMRPWFRLATLHMEDTRYEMNGDKHNGTTPPWSHLLCPTSFVPTPLPHLLCPNSCAPQSFGFPASFTRYALICGPSPLVPFPFPHNFYFGFPHTFIFYEVMSAPRCVLPCGVSNITHGV